MDNPITIINSKLAYQFYFLLRTERSKKDESIVEPVHLKQPDPSKLYVNYSQDDDKRLFRFDISDSTLLDLPQEALNCWQMLQIEYQNCQVTNHTTGQISQRDASAELLMGVAVVVIAENLTETSLSMMLRDSQGQEVGQMLFKPDKTLLSLSEKDREESSHLFVFKPRYAQSLLKKAKVSHWQLEWVKEEQWHLIPIRDEENDDNPIFAMYGISGQKDLVAKFADFLLYGEGGRKSRNTALMHLMSGLLMRDWQYSHIYAAASRLLDRLDKENAIYRTQTEEISQRTDIETLQVTLQAMKTLDAEAKHTLGRIQGAIKTLQINYKNLPIRMLTVQQRAKKQGWLVNWQWEQDSLSELQQLVFPDLVRSSPLEPALLEEFTFDIDELRNRQTYIEGASKHLEGFIIEYDWQLKLEKQRLELEKQQVELSERFGTVGHWIIFLVALAEMGHALKSSHKGTDSSQISHSQETAQIPHSQEADGMMSILKWLTDGIKSILNSSLELLQEFDKSFPIDFITQLLSSPSVYLVLVIVVIIYIIRDIRKTNKRREELNQKSQQPSVKKKSVESNR